MVTAWQGLGMGPFSILFSQLSPAMDDVELPWSRTKGHQHAHPRGSMSPHLFPGTAEEQLHWFWIHTVLIPIASCLLLLVLVVLLVRMER